MYVGTLSPVFLSLGGLDGFVKSLGYVVFFGLKVIAGFYPVPSGGLVPDLFINSSDLLLQRIDTSCQLLELFLIQSVVLCRLLCLVHKSLLCGTNLMDTLAYPGVFREICNLFQNLGLLVFIALQELGEFALGKHGRAAELCKIQPHRIAYCLFHIIGFVSSSGEGLFPGNVFNAPFHWIHCTGGLFPDAALHRPVRQILTTVYTCEIELDIGPSGVTSHQLAGVIKGKVVRIVLDLPVVSLVQSWCGVEQSQGDGVQDGGLAGSCFACDKKNIAVLERRSGKVNGCVLYGCNVMYLKFLYLHVISRCLLLHRDIHQGTPAGCP